MKELFEKQLNGAEPLTEDILKKLKIKTYFNGEEKQIGDVVLYAMLMSEVIEKEGEYPELLFDLITLNERHFDLLESVDRYNSGSELPSIKLKSISND